MRKICCLAAGVFWIEQVEEMAVGRHGIVAVDRMPHTTNIKVVSNDPLETEAILQDMGVQTIRTQAIELDEILAYLIKKNRVGTFK